MSKTFQVSPMDRCDYCDERVEFAGSHDGAKIVRTCAQHIVRAEKDLAKQKPKNVSPYIEIVEVGTSRSGITRIFEVRNNTKPDDAPGIIRWHGAWRGYVYECDASFYDSKCLRQIADFIDRINEQHKRRQK